MRFVAEQATLHHVLQTVSRIVSPQTTLPVLSGVLVEASTDGVVFSASDLVSRITASLACEVEEPGRMVLPAAMLTELIQRIPTAEVRVTGDDMTGRASVNYGKSHATLNGFAGTEMPQFPSLQDGAVEFVLGPGALPRMTRETLFSTARDETRPILKGVLLSVAEGKAVLVATDGTRLSHTWVPVPEFRGEAPSVVVPARALQEAQRLAGAEAVTVRLDSTLLEFAGAGGTLTTLLLDGRYPDYQRVVPSQYVADVRVPTGALRGALERVNLVAHRDRGGSIRFRAAPGRLEISTEAADVGQAYEELETEGRGEPMELSFNPSLLLDAVRSIDSEDVLMDFSGTQMPARIRPAEGSQYFHIVLPLRQLV